MTLQGGGAEGIHPKSDSGQGQNWMLLIASSNWMFLLHSAPNFLLYLLCQELLGIHHLCRVNFKFLYLSLVPAQREGGYDTWGGGGGNKSTSYSQEIRVLVLSPIWVLTSPMVKRVLNQMLSKVSLKVSNVFNCHPLRILMRLNPRLRLCS